MIFLIKHKRKIQSALRIINKEKRVILWNKFKKIINKILIEDNSIYQ
jgi:hypothetical protein